MSSIIPPASTPLVFTFPETGRPTLPEFPGGPAVRGLEGHLYVIEFNSNTVKVGFTTSPVQRINQHRAAAINYRRRARRGALTAPHVEARENEQALIKACREAADLPNDYSGEYFPISFEDAVGLIGDMPQSRGDRQAFESEVNAKGQRLVDAVLSVAGPPQAKFGPVFPWAKFMDSSSVDDFVRDLRNALEMPDPLAAVDHVAFDWFLNTAADLEVEKRAAAMRAAIQGGAA